MAAQPPPRRRGGSGLANEVGLLREQLGREQAETAQLVDQYTAKINGLVQENCQLQGKLLHTQGHESGQGGEASAVKRDVLEKNAAIEALMRELQQQQQATFEKIKSIAGTMLASCASKPREPSPAPSVDSRPKAYASGSGPHEGIALAPPKVAAPAGIGGGPGTASAGAMSDLMLDTDEQRWFRSVKANLEHFGGVEVFRDGSARDCACCLEPLNTVYRIRPKKCRHVFHVECLLQWWSEGTCPVCSVSFAPTPARGGSAQQSVLGQGGRSSDSHATPSSERGSA